MVITFVRSGGFAAVPALRVSGTVTIEPAGAFVAAEPSYRRALDADESRQLTDAAHAIAADTSVQPKEAEQVRDAYQFAFTIEQDGRRMDVRAGSGSSSISPALQRLVDWAGREATSVVRANIARSR